MYKIRDGNNGVLLYGTVNNNLQPFSASTDLQMQKRDLFATYTQYKQNCITHKRGDYGKHQH